MPDPRYIMRIASVRSPNRTGYIPIVLATENPVERWDERTHQVIREVLLMSGIKWRTAKRQLPIVDSHNRATIRGVHGSVRNLRVVDSQLVGNAMFASDDRSQAIYRKIIDGHITDFSVTASQLEAAIVQRGQSYRGIAGPCHVITSWQPLDASIVVSGADVLASLR